MKKNIAEWSTYVIAGKFMTKLDRLLLILADNKIEIRKIFTGKIKFTVANDTYIF